MEEKDALENTVLENTAQNTGEYNEYEAFISYRHLPLDMYVAKTLHKYLESFSLPKRLSAPNGKRKINRIFRDRDELPLSSNLSESIENALRVSDYLIVICTPQLKESEWCIKEIETFKKLHDQSHIFAVLVSGEPEDSIPEELLIEEYQAVNEYGQTVTCTRHVEPLAADVRGRNKREIRKKIKEESLRILAPIFGVTYDSLKQRHRERRLHKIITFSSAVATIFLAFGIISTSMAVKIHNQSEILKTEYAESLSEEAVRELEKGNRTKAEEILEEAESLKDSAPVRAAAATVNNTYALEGMLSVKYNLELGSGIYGMIPSPENNYIAVCDNLGHLGMLETATGKYLSVCEELGAVTISDKTALFSDNSHFVYNYFGFVCVYNIESGSNELMLSAGGNIACNNAGDTIFIVSEDGLSAYDLNTGDLLYSTKIKGGQESYLSVSENDKYLFVSYMNNEDYTGTYYIVDSADGKVLSEKQNAGGLVTGLAVNEDIFYETVTCISDDVKNISSYVCAVNASDGDIIWTSEKYDKTLGNIDFIDSDGGLLFVTSPDGPSTFDAKNGERKFLVNTEEDLMSSSKGEEEDSYYVMTKEGTVYRYYAVSGECEWTNEYVVRPSLKVSSAVFAEGQFFVYFQGADYLVAYEKLHTGELVGSLQKNTDGTYVLPGDNAFDFSQSIYTLYTWDEKIQKIDGESSSIMVKSRDGRYEAVYDMINSSIRVYDVEQGKKQGSVSVQTTFMTSVFFTEDNKYLCVTLQDGTLQIYDRENFNLVKELENDYIYINCIVPTRDNTYTIDTASGTTIVDDNFDVIWKQVKGDNHSLIGYDMLSEKYYGVCDGNIYLY